MDNRNALVGWSDDQWSRIRQAVSEEAHRGRVAASFLPTYGPLPASTQVVPSERVDAMSGKVDDVSIAPMVELYVEVVLSQQQVDEEELSNALLGFRQAANAVARVEDQIIFNGQHDYTVRNGTPARTLQRIINRPDEYHRVEAAPAAGTATAEAVASARRNAAVVRDAATTADTAATTAETDATALRDAATTADTAATTAETDATALRAAATTADTAATTAETAETAVTAEAAARDIVAGLAEAAPKPPAAAAAARAAADAAVARAEAATAAVRAVRAVADAAALRVTATTADTAATTAETDATALRAAATTADTAATTAETDATALRAAATTADTAATTAQTAAATLRTGAGMAAAAMNVYGRVKVKGGEQDSNYHGNFFNTYLLSKASLTGTATTREILDNFHYERLKATNPGGLGLVPSAETDRQVGKPLEEVVADIIAAVTQLEAKGHLAPIFCVLGNTAFVTTHTPIGSTGVLPSDRIEPILGSQLLRSSAIDPLQGVVLSLAGDSIDIAVAVDASPQFLNVNEQGQYRFRVVERFALRVKDPAAIVRLQFVP